MIRMRRNQEQVRGLTQLVLAINRKNPNTTVVEIGSFAGESASIIAPYVKKLYCVDPWIPHYAKGDGASNPRNLIPAELEFDKVVARHKNIEKLKMTSVEAAQLFHPCSIDWVYIDGDHKYRSVLIDIKAWRDKCMLAMAGHDYMPREIVGVKKAVNELLGEPDNVFEDNSWLKWI